jgi:hypothetical protein
MIVILIKSIKIRVYTVYQRFNRSHEPKSGGLLTKHVITGPFIPEIH